MNKFIAYLIFSMFLLGCNDKNIELSDPKLSIEEVICYDPYTDLTQASILGYKNFDVLKNNTTISHNDGIVLLVALNQKEKVIIGWFEMPRNIKSDQSIPFKRP